MEYLYTRRQKINSYYLFRKLHDGFVQKGKVIGMIKVSNVSMCYKIVNDKLMSLKAYVIAAAKRELKFKEFWVFKDVSFEVEKGDVVGIIGRNGAGKSTILKIIAGVLTPTEGKVEVEGNIVPMLELGSGFDFELSGRENIFLNGSILGYSEEFIKEKYDEIVEFSELGEFIDRPIRSYSSGMLMRLAFSIATVVEPEILIVDEILAVGDEAFQKKSKRKMLSLMSGGTTVLFVSHSIGQIREMCNKVVWLEDGKLRMMGETKKVCDAYQEFINPDSKTNTEKNQLYANEVRKHCRDVLFIYGNQEHNYYWRVAVEKEQLLSTNILSGEVYHENLTMDLVAQFRAFVFVECPSSDKTLDFIKEIKKYHKLILFDMSGYEDVQQQLLDMSAGYVDGIIVPDQQLGEKYSSYGEIFCNPYVATDRIAQLSTWANYDRDELPNLDPDTIDSEDMLINYNRAKSAKEKRESEGYRLGCFHVDWNDTKYESFRKMIIAYLQSNNTVRLYTVCEEGMVKKLFGKVSDRINAVPKLEWSDMPRMYSDVDTVLEIVEDGKMQSKDYSSQIVANLVKTPFCTYSLKEDRYVVFQDTEKAFVKEREQLTVNSGAKLSTYIRKKMAQNFAIVLDETDPEVLEKSKELASILFSRGYDVVCITEEQIEVDFPTIRKSEKYIHTKFDNAIATSWKSYIYIKSYADIKNRYYLTGAYRSERYDDGDYAKFAANQTFYPTGDIEYIALNESVSEMMEKYYGEKYVTMTDFIKRFV